MKFGEKILNLRKEKSLSQEQLAEKIGVTRQTISNWELEETSPTLKQLELLSKTFDVSIDCLYESDTPTVDVNKNNIKQPQLSQFIIKILKICMILLISYFILRVIFIIAFVLV